MESFSGKVRDKLLAIEPFHALLESKVMVEDFSQHCNNHRPHSLLNFHPRSGFTLDWNNNPGITKTLAHQTRLTPNQTGPKTGAGQAHNFAAPGVDDFAAVNPPVARPVLRDVGEPDPIGAISSEPAHHKTVVACRIGAMHGLTAM